MPAVRSPSRIRVPIVVALGVVLLASLFPAPAPGQRNLAGEVKLRLLLDQINNLGSVMMIAAHPDDENTALLAYLARGRHVRTASLPISRAAKAGRT